MEMNNNNADPIYNLFSDTTAPNVMSMNFNGSLYRKSVNFQEIVG